MKQTKKKRGQPSKGEDKLVSVSVQLHPDELDAVRKIADDELCSVSHAIRRMVRRALSK